MIALGPKVYLKTLTVAMYLTVLWVADPRVHMRRTKKAPSPFVIVDIFSLQHFEHGAALETAAQPQGAED